MAFAEAPKLARLDPFSLDDQSGRNQSIEFPLQKPAIITIADQKGAESLSPWIEALKSKFGTNVLYVRVADVAKVPAPLRSFVRSRFEKKYHYPVMMDWHGTVTKRLEAHSGEPNVLLVSKNGEVLARRHGSFAPGKLAGLTLGAEE